MAKRDGKLALVVTWHSEKPEQPPSLMAYTDDLLPILGRIVAQWSMLEQEVEVALASLLKLSGNPAPGWRRWPFKKRWTLLHDEWALFAHGYAELGKEWPPLDDAVRKGQIVRNHISHSRICFGLDERGHWLRFQTDNSAYPWSKKYRPDDLSGTAKLIAQAAGRLFRLTVPEHARHLSEQSVVRLRDLPNMVSLRAPT